ncbi:adenylate/guanylate cyclase domain-containing protein [Myxococcota bacterium]|nr:adenylate/guanylate cyclase domain-containing protein [Myxococcota bacterium]MBU1432857.1 adenylate/guanylate cyclase domain-containing protein [Myxococcota bacterium]MBU1898034.1 adenylate/guanylate cyclase domain-containing protein [Myxococcota bacterium]
MHEPNFDDTTSDKDAARLEALLGRLEGGRASAKDISELVSLVYQLREEHAEQVLLSQTVLEHSTDIENELSERNERISALIDNMKRYLSGRLFELIVGGGLAPNTLSYRRRRLTVFFSDLVGFTELTDAVEAEVLSDVLNTYLNRMAEIADEWGGTIDKFIGDAVMVFFGDADDADDADQALRCVRMALEMQLANAALTEVWRAKGIDRPLRARIGINTGHCTVGNFGSEQRMDYTIIGSPVNVASRLEGLAEAGGILISGSTYHLVKHAVTCAHRGEVRVKGVNHPVDAWDVIGLREQAASPSRLLTARDDGGFDLASLSFSPTRCGAIERAEVSRALRQALALVTAGAGPLEEDDPSASPRPL